MSLVFSWRVAQMLRRRTMSATPTILLFKSRAPLYFSSIFLISVISGDTPLMKTSWNGKLVVTRFLVESKANVEAKNNEYYTPTTLPWLYFGSIFLISVISGYTPLMYSSSNGNLDVTRFLVESGANVEAENNMYYPYNTTFQIARTAVFRFNFSNFCYQWLHSAHMVLFEWKTWRHSFSRGEWRKC
jgi:hypothetical protein